MNSDNNLEINLEVLPKTGDYDAYKAYVWHNGELQFTLVCKLTGTELAVSLAKGCIKSSEEAYEGLKQFTLQEAKRIYTNQEYSPGGRKVIFYSPCW